MSIAAVRSDGSTPTPPDSGSAWTTALIMSLIAAVVAVAGATAFTGDDETETCMVYQLHSTGVASGGIRADSIGGLCTSPNWRPAGVTALGTAYDYAERRPDDWFRLSQCRAWNNTTLTGWVYLLVAEDSASGQYHCTLTNSIASGDSVYTWGWRASASDANSPVVHSPAL